MVNVIYNTKPVTKMEIVNHLLHSVRYNREVDYATLRMYFVSWFSDRMCLFNGFSIVLEREFNIFELPEFNVALSCKEAGVMFSKISKGITYHELAEVLKNV